jgi:hypothetical protein
MNRRLLLSAVVVLAGSLLGAHRASAAQVTLNAVDSGFYNSLGNSPFSNGNYAAGWFVTSVPAGEARSFFVFDLASVGGTITSATLRITMPDTAGYVSSDPTETLSLFALTTPVATITSRASSLSVFNDLGDGSVYGAGIFSSANVNSDVEIAFNPTGLGFLNCNNGQVAFGGAVSSFSTFDPYDQSMFSNTSTASTRQLILEVDPVPEPASGILAGIGAAALLARRKRRS